MKTGIFYLSGLVFAAILFSCTKKELPAKCNMDNDPGICNAAIPKYYYNPSTQQCEQFTWGGCGDFPFGTLQECESLCER